MFKKKILIPFFIFFFFIIILVSIIFLKNNEKKNEPTHESPVQKLIALYNEVEKTPSSPMSERLSKIVNNRMNCYNKESDLSTRIEECRKDYIREIVFSARKGLKSVPMLGDFVLCIRYCPIIYAMCIGDENIKDSEDCVGQEVQCIDYCFDNYWRGGNPPKERRAW